MTRKKNLSPARTFGEKGGPKVSKVLNAVSSQGTCADGTSFPSPGPLLFRCDEANLTTFKSSFRGARASLLAFGRYTRRAK